MMQEYKTFIETCLEGLDENAVNPADLFRCAERFNQIRACFLTCEPIEGDQNLEHATLAFKAQVRTGSSDLLREVDKSLSILAEFADAKARASKHRLRGKIAVATHLETLAETRYRQLPEKWKW